MTETNGTAVETPLKIDDGDVVWNVDMLTGKTLPPSPSHYEHQEMLSSPSKKRLHVPVPHLRRHKSEKPDPALWGIPGHLTEEEAQVFMKFRSEIAKRGPEFKETIFSFGTLEEEAFCLCRWLRARKFVYEDVITMVEEATECREDPKKHDFYPNAVAALGCEASLFYSLYPQLYTGQAKNGAPLFISKPGVLHVDGMECITTLDGIIKFHWHVMIHDFAQKLQKRKEADVHFKKFECFCVLDLAHLTTAQLGSRSLDIIKEQSFIDSLCFPETMSKMIIVNAPRFFAMTWRLIKGWLDARTASKIEVITSRSAWVKRLNELIEADQLPVDYGGTARHTDNIIAENNVGGLKKLTTDMLYVRGHGSSTTDVSEGEELEIQIWTTSSPGAAFTITHPHSKNPPVVAPVDVKHNGSERPSHQTITTTHIAGPTKIKVKADSHAGRFTTENFLVVYRFYNKK